MNVQNRINMMAVYIAAFTLIFAVTSFGQASPVDS